MKRSIDDLLAEARSGLQRLSPLQAINEVEKGALLIDIRPQAQRMREGEVPFSIIIERNVLEWRLDPKADSCIPEIVDHDQAVIVMCSEGYTSSLAAASLQELGLMRATDVEGGFMAWKQADLPTQAGGTPAIP